MGPVFKDTRSLIASASIDIINARSWIYRRLPWPAQIAYAANATAVGVVLTFTIGSDVQVGPEDPVDAGGTVGIFPNQEEDFSVLVGAANDLLTFLIRNTTVGAIDLQTVIKLTPLI